VLTFGYAVVYLIGFRGTVIDATGPMAPSTMPDEPQPLTHGAPHADRTEMQPTA